MDGNDAMASALWTSLGALVPVLPPPRVVPAQAGAHIDPASNAGSRVGEFARECLSDPSRSGQALFGIAEGCRIARLAVGC